MAQITKLNVLKKAIEIMDCSLWEAASGDDLQRYAFYMEGVREMAQAVIDLIDGKV